jgi:glycosidase
MWMASVAIILTGRPLTFGNRRLDTLKGIPNHKLLLLSEGGRKDHYKAGFDYNFGFNFFGNLKAIFNRSRPASSIDSLNNADYTGTDEGQQIVRYSTNHDVNSSDGTPEELFGGKKGAMAAFVVIAYMKSVPMIYNGQEVGTPYRLLFPFTAKKIDWSLNADVTAEYKKIIKFRNDSKAIRRGKLTSYSSADVCAFTKEEGGERVFVLSNLRNKRVTYAVPENLSRTNWKIVFTGAKMGAPNRISLGPYSYLVLKN